MNFPEEMKIEAAEAYRQISQVPEFEHTHKYDWIYAWCCGATYQIKKQQAEPLPPIVQGLIDGQKKINDQLREVAMWRVDEPPKNKRIELLCVLFDEDEYRTLKKNEWNDEYNRFIVTGTWNGAYFRGEIHHASGDPFPQVVAWRPMEEPNLGAPFYTKCLGECRD